MRLRRKARPLVYRLVLPLLNHLRRQNADTVIDGIELRTNSEVFHPGYFFSGKILGRYLASRVTANQTVLDMGTGSGVIGIMAAKRGARVLAVDVNPAAVALATENVCRHNLTDRWRCLESDLFARLDPSEKFDWIAFNPPYFPGPVRRPEEAAWYAGENYETLDRFFSQAQNFLNQGGKIVLVISSDMPLILLHDKFQRFAYHLVAHESQPHLFEIFHLVQLQPRV
jgi:release factor glutamine methyltransferase